MSEASFPHGNWGRDDVSPLFKPVFAFAASPFGSRVIRAIVPFDRRVVDRTKGRFSLFGPLSMPELLLTTTGRRSGQPRTSVLSYIHEGDRLLVMGSNFGQQHHPSWSSNLVAEPQASISMAGQDIPVTATCSRTANGTLPYSAFSPTRCTGPTRPAPTAICGCSR